MEYHPVNCGFYDYFEACITLRERVKIIYLNEEGQTCIITAKPTDLQLKNGGEFLVLENGEYIRLDFILQFNGVENPSDKCAL